MSGSTKLVYIAYGAGYTSLFKCLRALSEAANKNNISLDVVILNSASLTSIEWEVCSGLNHLTIIKDVLHLDDKYHEIIILTASTIISPCFLFDVPLKKGHILLPHFLVKFGSDLTIEDISHPEFPSRSFARLNSYLPLWAGVRFTGNLAELFQNVKGAPADLNELFARTEEVIVTHLTEVRYLQKAISFFRVDKYTANYTVQCAAAASRKTAREFLKAVVASDLYMQEKRGEHEEMVASFDVPPQLKNIGVDAKVISHWRAANKIDPQIRPSHVLLDNMLIEPFYEIDQIMSLYAQIEETLPDKTYEHLVLVPHARTGGADKAAAHLISYLGERRKTIVMTTEVRSSSTKLEEWGTIKGIDVLDSKDILVVYPNNVQLAALRLLIGCIAPTTVDVINSQLGYDYAGSAYTDINRHSDWFFHAFAHVYEEGYMIPPFHNGLGDVYHAASKYITDSIHFKSELSSLYGIPEAKIEVIYVPLNKNNTKTQYARTNKILWIGRICEEKLVTVLIDIAAILTNEGISIDVWGPVDEAYISEDTLSTAPGINYKGTYSHPDEVNIDDYDMLLFTTINEGMPNVILESTVAGLFIIAPPVGGITEIIRDRENGISVTNKFEASAYVAAIKTAYEDGLFNNKISLKEQAVYVSNRHSPESYQTALNKMRHIK